MAISRDRSESALSLIKHDLKEGTDLWMWYTKGTFIEFSSDLGDPSHQNKDEALKAKCVKMRAHLIRIETIWIPLSLCAIRQVGRRMVREGHVDTFSNMVYGSALADAFITKYRSSYDTIAGALKQIANHPESVLPKFRDLRRHASKMKV